jgi:hypothetical protein
MKINYPKLKFKPEVDELIVAEPIAAHYELMNGLIMSFAIVLTKYYNIEVIDQTDGTVKVIHGGLEEAYKYAQAKFEYDLDKIINRIGVVE